MKFRPAFALLSLTLAVAGCGNLPFTSPEPETPAHSGPPTVSPLEQPIQTSNEGRAVSTAEATTMNTAMFRASGNEPFWAVTADSKTAVLERPGARSVGISVQRLTYARGVEFIGVLNGRAFSLNIQAASCTDSMSGQKFPFTARVNANGQRMTGCAGPAEVMPKAQTRASSAVAAPKPAAAKPAAPAAPKPEPAKPEPAKAEPAKPETDKPAVTTPDDAAMAPATSATTTTAPDNAETVTTPDASAPASAATPDAAPAADADKPASDPAPVSAAPAPAEDADKPASAGPLNPILPQEDAAD